ncbi:MAG: UDP-N-acetylmuramoyl-L-alanyl-D-glutamate--2,6-diaminopimelate ligase [Ktedonobacteraceae bacterium]
MQLHTLLASLEQPPLTFHTKGEPAINDYVEITGLAYDSRQIEAGGLFVAVPGDHIDGRRFLSDAAQRGAVVALGESLQDDALASLPLPYIEVRDVRIALANLGCAFYGYPARHLCTIGVTGTCGKTTTSNLISALLEAAGLRTGLMTTANFRVCGQEWANTTRQTTQEALEVQHLLRHMLDTGATHAVIESTSHGLGLQRVAGCDFDVGVITNITHEHLDFHKTMEAYQRAKARLFEMLDPTRDKGLGVHPVAILNRDDTSYAVLKPYCRVPILDYGIDSPAAVRAVDVRLQAHSTHFRLILPDIEVMVETQFIGRYNVSNCLAAIATVYSLGVTPLDIAQGLSEVTGVAGRMESIHEGQSFYVIVDFAHTPDSLEKVLATLRSLTSGKLMAVFGSAGGRDIQKRPIMGRIAAQMTDFFVITNDDPREEDPEAILWDIAHGAEAIGKRYGQDFLCILDRTQAIATAFALARSGDTVLLAGKGHEQCIIVGREKVPWDDRRVAREQIRMLENQFPAKDVVSPA